MFAEVCENRFSRNSDFRCKFCSNIFAMSAAASPWGTGFKSSLCRCIPQKSCFLTTPQTTASFCKNLIITLVFEGNAIFSPNIGKNIGAICICTFVCMHWGKSYFREALKTFTGSIIDQLWMSILTTPNDSDGIGVSNFNLPTQWSKVGQFNSNFRFLPRYVQTKNRC
jgi:hypothetical protein